MRHLWLCMIHFEYNLYVLQAENNNKHHRRVRAFQRTQLSADKPDDVMHSLSPESGVTQLSDQGLQASRIRHMDSPVSRA